MGKDNYKMKRGAFKFWDLVRLILETLRYIEWVIVVNIGSGDGLLLDSTKPFQEPIMKDQKQNS